MEENKGPAPLMQIVQHLILFALNMDFANVKVISRGIQSAGRGAKEEVDKEEVDKEEVDKEEVDKEAAPQTPIVRRLIQSAQSLDSANVQHISQVILSAGVNWQQQQEEKEEEAVLQTPIAQLLIRSAPNLDSASVSATSLAMQSAGAKEKQCAVAGRLEEKTLAAILTPIVLPLTLFALSLAFASAAAMRREMRSVGGEETLCVVDGGRKECKMFLL